MNFLAKEMLYLPQLVKNLKYVLEFLSWPWPVRLMARTTLNVFTIFLPCSSRQMYF